MPIRKENTVFFQRLARFSALVLAVAVLTACDMPTEPEGVNVEGLTHIGDQLRKQGDDAGAAEFYQRALQRKPDDLDARMALAEILEAHGDNANAAEEYREALAVDPDNGELHRDLGRVFIKLGRPQDAQDQYQRALRIDSDDVKALNGLGIALDYLGKHEAAQKIYQEALDDEPDDLATINNLGHSYVLSGAYDEAIKLLEPHLNDKGASPAMRQNLAEAYGMNGMDADAERVGKIDLTPDQIKHNLDYYHARRAQLAVAPRLYADLGGFPTEAMAQADAARIRNKFPKETAGIVITVTPDVKEIGGTPVFTVQATGFVHVRKLRDLCDRLKKEKLVCVAHEK